MTLRRFRAIALESLRIVGLSLVLLLVLEGLARLVLPAHAGARAELFDVMGADGFAALQRGGDPRALIDSAYDIFDRDRERIWRVRPNLAFDASALSLGSHRAWTIHTDDLGRRVGARAASSSDAPQVIALGDSSTFGWGVEDEQGWPALVAAAMPERAVVNLAVPGYSIAQGTLALDDVALGAGDVLVAAFGANDGHMTLRADEEVLAQRRSWIGYLAFPLSSSRLLIAAQDVFFPMQTSTAIARWQEGAATPRVDADRFGVLLADLGTRARAAHASLVILDVCARDEYRAAMTRVAEAGHFPLVRYRDVDGSTLDGCHPTPEGHVALARALAREM